MKHNIKRALALFIALLMAVPTFTFAEEPDEAVIVLEEVPAGEAELAVPDPEPEVMELEDVPLELPDLDIDLPVDGLIQGNVGEPTPDSVATWCFIVEDTLFATQEARDGDLILRPEDPAAPEGQLFAGWALEDGTRLFVDADGDGETDPVIAHPDPLCPEVNVFARFVAAGTPVKEPAEAGQPAGEEQPTEVGQPVGKEQPTEVEKPAETEQSVEEEQPAEEEKQPPEEEQPTDTQKPSPDGEGGSAEALTDEVLLPEETITGDEQPAEEEQPTDTQKPSPSGEGGAAQSAVTEEVVPPEGMVAEEDQEQPAKEEEHPAEKEQHTDTQTSSPATEGSDSGEGGAAQSAVTEEVVSPEGIVAEDDQEQPAEAEQPTEGESTGEEPPEQPTGEATEEEANEVEPTPEGESTVEEDAQQPADEVEEEEIPIEDPAESEGEAIQPVSVVFDAMPETAVVTVRLAPKGSLPEGAGSPEGETEGVVTLEAIPAQADGSFALLPGEYTYMAEAEGYVSLENVPFTVTGDEQPLLLSFALEESPKGSLSERAGTRSVTEGVAFDQSRTVNGVVVTIRAEPGVFPDGAELSVKRVPVYKQRQADAAVEEVRDENQNVAVSYTFDIKVIDPATREELQPAEGQKVEVSFALAEVADENLETSVYHIDDSGAAQKLDVTQEDEVTAGSGPSVSVETEGFSLYTVEFTYNMLEYVLPGDSSVALSEILSTLGLTGAVETVEISAPACSQQAMRPANGSSPRTGRLTPPSG